LPGSSADLQEPGIKFLPGGQDLISSSFLIELLRYFDVLYPTIKTTKKYVPTGNSDPHEGGTD
jgi:hypothetical protein